MSVMTFRTKIILLTIAVITAIATVFAAMYKPKRSNTIVRPIIKIAAELPLSGPENHLGLAAQQAIQNSLRQADASAGYKYEVNYIDKSNLSTLPPDTKAVLSFEDIRIKKEMRGKVNRLVNCETANLTKTINASVEQINAIKKLKQNGKFSKLNDNLKEIANLRLKYPDLSYEELGQKLVKPVGKSGVNYRLKKIIEIAQG